MTPRRDSPVFLSKEEFKELVHRGSVTLRIPVPTTNLCIDRLEGEELSAWTVERYLKNGKPYQKCTRLYPFGLRSGHLWVKVKHSREYRRAIVASCRVVQRKGAWTWVVCLQYGA